MYLPPRTHRPLIMGRNGAVGSNHPMATQAGLDILRAGGNAIDAAVATALALAVCEPSSSGLGGDGFYHVHTPAPGHDDVFNGTGTSPLAATPEAYSSGIPNSGPRSVSVPGLLAGLGAMHKAHGSRPWASLVQPAITLAREGFAATWNFVRGSRENHDRLATDPRSAQTFLGKAIGDLVTQPDLARTLDEIAADGPDTFYRGRLAARLAAALANSGTILTQADLERTTAETQPPIAITYRGWTIRQTPPNSTGFTMPQMLKIIERFDIAAADPAQRIHLLVEAKKRAFLDRETYGADPRFEAVPLDLLLSEAHADHHAAAINPNHAATIDPPALAAGGDTTYFAIVDTAGNAVSAVQSINSGYGSGTTAGTTGILLNNRMAYWHLAPNHPNRLVPTKRVRHTMNAPMVFKDGKLALVLGTPGADNQVQVNLQVLTAILDLGADPQTALEAPRWTSSQPDQGANYPHTGENILTIETDFGEPTLTALEQRGHTLARVPHLGRPCAMQAIQILPNDIRAAASDPRRDGWAGAF